MDHFEISNTSTPPSGFILLIYGNLLHPVTMIFGYHRFCHFWTLSFILHSLEFPYEMIIAR